jgi:Flp pilus assembly protein TadG
MLKRPAPNSADGAGERGSVAVFTAVFAFAVLLLLAVLVDGGSALSARERAADIAEQAARAAVTDLSVPDLRAVPPVVAIDWNTACQYAMQAVQDYALNSNDASVQMTYCGVPQTPPSGESLVPPGEDPGRTAMVTVQVRTNSAIPGFPSLTMTATQTATADCGNADQQEVC